MTKQKFDLADSNNNHYDRKMQVANNRNWSRNYLWKYTHTHTHQKSFIIVWMKCIEGLSISISLPLRVCMWSKSSQQHQQKKNNRKRAPQSHKSMIFMRSVCACMFNKNKIELTMKSNKSINNQTRFVITLISVPFGSVNISWWHLLKCWHPKQK